MGNINEYGVHPREVADKSSKEVMVKAIKLALDVESDSVRHNTQTFNTNRYKTVKKMADYEELKDQARRIKEEAIKNLPFLIEKLTQVIRQRGGYVFLAKTEKQATEYIKNVCLKHEAKLVVKAKSITSEEIGLNPVLESCGIEVAETDLAEFILQVSKEQPSHNVAPAIHRSRESISELFKQHFVTDKPLDTSEKLTEFARDILRQKFLSADIGISGANLIAADEGSILLVESEGNIRLATQLPAVHIAISGIEKIIPFKKDFGTFIELLAASGTGQPLTTYTNILEPPLELPVLNLNGRSDSGREFHLVLLDNGRMKMREDAELREALYCIRCSACMNSCANFQAVGGHAFGGEVYTGGIGGSWTIGTSGSLQKGRFAELCSGCSRCVPNCPVRIDIPRLNTTIKSRLIKSAGTPPVQKLFFGNFSLLGRLSSIAPGIVNYLSNLSVSRFIMDLVVGFDKRRAVPKFAKKTLVRQYKSYRRETEPKRLSGGGKPGVILFADVYTNYTSPEIGMATVRAFEKLGIGITLSKVMDEGRALQSQGLVDEAKKCAVAVSAYLERLVDGGNEIIVVEPSVLAIFRYDYKALLGNPDVFTKIAQHVHDPLEYLNTLVERHEITFSGKINRGQMSNRIFYHAHCQMKTIGAGNAATELFGKLGIVVDTSTVECCGMAGSFGYKKQYFGISKNVGNDLIKQITGTTDFDTDSILFASGTSCREQISGELRNRIYHPVEYLEKILK